jgi:hypothetical protein
MAVTLVEHLLQQLRALLRARRQEDAEHVQVVIAGGGDAVDLQTAEQAVKLALRQAGADDGAVEACVQVPDPKPALLVGACVRVGCVTGRGVP